MRWIARPTGVAMNAKAALKLLLPPAILAIAKRLSTPAVSFTGDYGSWEEASAGATGYDTQEILRRVLAATRKVAAGEAVYERDSVVFDHIEYSWPLLASLLQVAAERKSLRVIDVGGSLGSTWRQNRKFLERLELPLAWRVVEQPHFVSIGREEFSDEVLRFYASIDEAQEGGADVVLFCSSLCYLPEPRAFLDAAARAAPYLIIDRLPLNSGEKDRIALQKVGEPIYTASYPVRLFSKENLLRNVLSRWRLIETWNCDLQPDPMAQCQGFFMEKV